MDEKTLPLFKTKRFMPLFICQSLAAFGDNLIRTTLATFVTFQAVHLDPTLHSLVVTLSMALFMLPFIILSATGGKLADKYNKAQFIRVIKFMAIPITSIGIYGFYTENYFLMLLSIFLTGVDATLFGPVKYSILPDHLKKDELLVANGLIEAGTFVSILLGIIVGGMAVEHASIYLFLVALGVFAATLFIPDTVNAAHNIPVSWNLIRETIDCVNDAKKDRDTWLAILGISWFWLLGGVFMSQMPTFTKEILNGNNSVYILLLGLFSVGTGVGSLVCNRLLKGQIDTQYVPISMFCMTGFTFLLWYASTHFVPGTQLRNIAYFLSSLRGQIVALSTFMIAMFGGIYIVPLYAFLQVRAKRAFRSRIIAANNIVNAFYIVSASILVMGLLAIGMKVSDVIMILAIANFLTSFYICRLLPDTIIKNIFQTIFRLLFKIEIEGMENYHKAGERVLIIANHASFIDPPLLGAFLPSRLVFAIDTQQAQSFWIKPFLSYLRAYPIDPTNPMATKTLIDQLKQNKNVVIFPEGRITVTGSMMKIYEGPGLIADKADAKLLPIRIDGPQYSPFSRMHGKLKLKWFPRIKITIMKPEKIEAPEHLQGRERRKFISKKLYDIMSTAMFTGANYQRTMLERVIDAAEQFGDKHLIIQDADHNKLTYRKLFAGIFLLADKFIKQTTKGEYVGILLPTMAGTAATIMAMQAIGRIPSMLNYSTGVQNIVNACKAAKIEKIYTAKRFIEKANLHEVIKTLEEHNIKIIHLEDIRQKINIFNKIAVIFKALRPIDYYKQLNKYHIPSANTPAIALFTSGSEGAPKAVVLSHENLQANITQALSRIDLAASDVVFNALPLFHSFGIMGGLFMPILMGIKVFLYPSPLHYRVVPEMIYGCNATVMFGTDTFLSGYSKVAHPYDFFSVRYIFAGAEKLREETRKVFMEKFGIRILPGYGTTETSPVLTVNTPMHYKAGTVGRFLPAIQYRLIPVPGIEEGGRLIVKGPNVMLGYLRIENPGVIEAPEYYIDGKNRKGWYDTGDIVKVDEEGFVTILGRAKRFAKIAGEMVSLSAVEEALTEKVEFLYAVISIQHHERGEMLCLFTNDPNMDRHNALSLIKKAGFSEIHVPKIIHYLEDIPVLATGKIDYVTLQNTNLEIQVPSHDNSEEIN